MTSPSLKDPETSVYLTTFGSDPQESFTPACDTQLPFHPPVKCFLYMLCLPTRIILFKCFPLLRCMIVYSWLYCMYPVSLMLPHDVSDGLSVLFEKEKH